MFCSAPKLEGVPGMLDILIETSFPAGCRCLQDQDFLFNSIMCSCKFGTRAGQHHHRGIPKLVNTR